MGVCVAVSHVCEWESRWVCVRTQACMKRDAVFECACMLCMCDCKCVCVYCMCECGGVGGLDVCMQGCECV